MTTGPLDVLCKDRHGEDASPAFTVSPKPLSIPILKTRSYPIHPPPGFSASRD